MTLKTTLPWVLVLLLAATTASLWLSRRSLEAVCGPSLYPDWDWSCQVRISR